MFFFQFIMLFFVSRNREKESGRCEKIDENERHFLKLNSTKLCAINTSLTPRNIKDLKDCMVKALF